MSGEENGISRNDSIWNKLLLCGALFGGLGSGVISATSTADRYTGSDAEKDFRLRDIQIQYLTDNYKELSARLQKLHENNPPQAFILKLEDNARRIRDLESENIRVHRGQ